MSMKMTFPRNNGVLVVLCGAPGSGKTTARNMLVEEYGFLSVCPDDIRKEVLGDEECQEEGERIFDIAFSKLRYFLAYGNVVFDATNARSLYRRKLLEETDGCRTMAIAIVMDTPLDICLENNRKRRRQVPEDVIERMYRSLEAEPPSTDEGFDAVVTYENSVRDIFNS